MGFDGRRNARLITCLAAALGCVTMACADTPPWAGSQVGRTDEVLKPWTPVVAYGNNISCWGRTYSWGISPFPEQVVTQGKQVLAGPIQVSATVAGQQVSWQSGGSTLPGVVSATGNLATITRTMTGGGLVASGTATVEFDGMIRVDFSIAASSSAVEVSSLVIDIPYNRECATLMHQWPMDDGTWVSNSGAAPSATTQIKFHPMLWFGNEDGGLCWFAEDDKGWKPADANAAVEMLPQADKFVLRLHMWDVPRTLSAAQSFTMGLHATPVKPWPSDYHKRFINGNIGYGTASSWLDDQKAKGVTDMCTGAHWCDIQNYGVAGQPAEFTTLVGDTRSRGMKVIPYFGFEISDIAPEWPTYNQEVRVLPNISIFHVTPDYYPTMPEQYAYAVCYRSHWADFMLERMVSSRQAHGYDGMYLDGTAAPWGCANSAHGCGFAADDGTTHLTYPIFAVRDMMKRINKIFANDAGEQVIAHVSSGPMIPTVSFATYYMDGEHVGNMTPKSNPLQVMSLESFRAEFMGRNWGVPDLMLDCSTASMSRMQLLSISLLHNVIPRSTLDPNGASITASYKRVYRDFEADEADWLPYWKNSQYVSTSDVNVKVSMHRSRSRKLLLAISNLGDSDLSSVTVTLNLAALGLPVKVGAVDAFSGESIAVSNGGITIPLPAFKPRLIVVSGDMADGLLAVSSSGSGGSVAIYNADNGALIDNTSLSSLGGFVTSYFVDFGPDGKLYVCKYYSTTAPATTNDLLRCPIGTWTPKEDFVTVPSHRAEGIRFGPDGYLYVVRSDGTLFKANIMPGSVLSQVTNASLGSSTREMAISSGGIIYVASYSGQKISRYDINAGQQMADIATRQINGNPTYPNTVALGPDKTGDGKPDIYVGSGSSPIIDIYDSQSGAYYGVFDSLANYGMGTSTVTGITFSGDLSTAYFAGSGGIVFKKVGTAAASQFITGLSSPKSIDLIGGSSQYSGPSNIITGVVELPGYGSDITKVGVVFELRRQGMLMRTDRQFLEAYGGFTLSDIDPGTYDLTIKQSHCLKRVLTGITIGQAPIDVGIIALTQGDLNGSNMIDSADTSILSSNYGSN